MPRALSEARAMEEYAPISSITTDSKKFNDLREYTNQITELDADRSRARSILSKSDNMYRALKNNIGMLLNQESVQYRTGGYAFKLKRNPTTKTSLDHNDFENNMVEGVEGLEPDVIIDVIRSATMLHAYQMAFAQFGIDPDVIEAIWNKSMVTEEAGMSYSMEIYAYQYTGDAADGEEVASQVLGQKVDVPQVQVATPSRAQLDAAIKPTMAKPAVAQPAVRKLTFTNKLVNAVSDKQIPAPQPVVNVTAPVTPPTITQPIPPTITQSAVRPPAMGRRIPFGGKK